MDETSEKHFSHALKDYHPVTTDDTVYTMRLTIAGCQKGWRTLSGEFDHPVCVCVLLEWLQHLPFLWETPLCANRPQRKVSQSEIRESSLCKDGECWLRCSSRVVWTAALSYSPSLSPLIHQAPWARTRLQQLFLYNNRPLLSVCLPLSGFLIYNAHFFPLSSILSHPLSHLFPSRLCPLLPLSKFTVLIITDKCFRLLELTDGMEALLTSYVYNMAAQITFCFDALLTPSLWVFANDSWAHEKRGPVENTDAALSLI